MKERRFAILLGMNNYQKNPLLYSVKDVKDLHTVLISHCKFEEENVVQILDSTSPVKEQLNDAFALIESKFCHDVDLFLFYYSGHGEYNREEEKSVLLFEDNTTIAIGDIVMNYFEPLKAKNQYLIIDACHSGKNFYIKPKNNIRKRERKLLNDSKELYFLFAAEENKKAYQNDRLKNSYYTFYFTEAIRNNTIYDEDGWLTMNSIDEYVRKKISNHKDIIQIPGSESRTTGYKPFAFINTGEKLNKINSEINKSEIMSASESDFNLGQSLTTENREKIQHQIKLILESEFDHISLDELTDQYEMQKRSKYDTLPHDLEEALEKSIISKADRLGLGAINNVFKVRLLSQNRKKTGLSSMFDMIHGEAEPEYSYNIHYDDSVILSAFIELKAKNYENVSGGLFCLFYQTKYGFVYCKTFFKYEWAGTHEKISKFVNVDLTPFTLREENIKVARMKLSSSLGELKDNIKKWNEERRKEIADFLSKAK